MYKEVNSLTSVLSGPKNIFLKKIKIKECFLYLSLMASLCDSQKMRLACYSYDMAAGTFPGNCNDTFFNMELGCVRVSRYSKAVS